MTAEEKLEETQMKEVEDLKLGGVRRRWSWRRR